MTLQYRSGPPKPFLLRRVSLSHSLVKGRKEVRISLILCLPAFPHSGKKGCLFTYLEEGKLLLFFSDLFRFPCVPFIPYQVREGLLYYLWWTRTPVHPYALKILTPIYRHICLRNHQETHQTNPVQSSTAQYSLVPLSTVQYRPVESSTAQLILVPPSTVQYHVQMCSNLFKCVQTCSNFFKTCSNVINRVQMGSNLLKTCSNEFKFVQMYSNVFKWVQNLFKTCSNLFTCVKTCSNLFKTCSNMFKCVQTCSNMFKLVQNLFKCVQMCSNLFKTCSNVFKHGQTCSKRVQMCSNVF